MLATSTRPRGLTFELQPASVRSDPNRADIALFVGWVARRTTRRGAPTALPNTLLDWFDAQGWSFRVYTERITQLKNLPVPIDNWQTFDALFAWDERPVEASPFFATTWLGAAVRSFFAQGGRKCYVVRVDAPWTLSAAPPDEITQQMQLAQLVPGLASGIDVSPNDPTEWRGIAHLYGLPDVSFVCLPDLPELVASELPALEPAPLPPGPRQRFLDCSENEALAFRQDTRPRLRAPRTNEAGYQLWTQVIHRAARILARTARHAQLIAAVPMPDEMTRDAERDLLDFLGAEGRGPLNQTLATEMGIASAFVQLVYPWARTPGSTHLPEGLETPDGILAGVLARSALTQGTFHSAGALDLGDVIDVYPRLSRAQMETPHLDTPPDTRAHTLVERITLLGETADGLRLLSDVTTSLDESYRPACINRLVASIVRAAQRLGDEVTFEPSGERLWADIRARLNRLLLGLWRMNALRGATPPDAFQVRCDRSTMTQNDLDAGRVIAEIEFDAAAPVERITIVLALNEGGQVSLVNQT